MRERRREGEEWEGRRVGEAGLVALPLSHVCVCVCLHVCMYTTRVLIISTTSVQASPLPPFPFPSDKLFYEWISVRGEADSRKPRFR